MCPSVVSSLAFFLKSILKLRKGICVDIYFGPEKGLLFVCVVVKFLSFLFGLLGQKNSLDVWQYTTLSDGDSGKKLVQFLVVTNGELKMSRDDPSLLVVSGGIACQLENLSSQVLQNSGQVDWCTSTHTLGIIALSEQTMDTTDGKLKPGTAGSSLALSLYFTAFASS